MTDSQFIKGFGGMIGGLVALAVVLFVIANSIGAGYNDKAIAGPNASSVSERVKPVGTLSIANSAENAVVNKMIPAAKADIAQGKSVYDSTCFACHSSGAAGAPKFGDKDAWKSHIAKGLATLDTHALNGFQGKTGMMPAKGGNSGLSDAEVKAAVAYMVSHSK